MYERARAVLVDAEPDAVVHAFDLGDRPSPVDVQALGTDHDAIVSIGTPAFEAAVEHLPDADHVYSMVVTVRPDLPGAARGRVRGISILPAPASYITYAKEIQSGSRTIGLLYVSEAFDDFVGRLKHAAEAAGLAVVAEKLDGRQDLVPAFDRVVKSNIDTFFILPDFSLYDTKAIEHVILNTYKRGIPCIGPSESFVRSGALWAFVIDPVEVGAQLGALVARGEAGVGEDHRHYRPASVALNAIVMEKLDLDVPFRIRRDARIIDPRKPDEE